MRGSTHNSFELEPSKKSERSPTPFFPFAPYLKGERKVPIFQKIEFAILVGVYGIYFNPLVSFKSVGVVPLSFTAAPVSAMAIFLNGISIALRASG
jgi:hypothetical protein